MLEFLTYKIQNNPKIFGVTHFIMLALFLLFTILICLFLRKTTDKQHKIILLSVGFVLLFFEILKQICLSYGGYEYQHLPLQPCSALMYTIIVVGFTCNNKKCENFNNYLYAFLFVFGFFSGMSAIVMPSAIFSTSYLLLLYQSIQHHLLISLLSIYLFVRGCVKINFKTFLKGTAVFLVWCVFAFILNWVFGAIFNNPEINLMYVGPWKIWDIPLVSDFIKFNSVWAYLPFYLFIYSFASLFAIYVIKLFDIIIKAIFKKKQVD